jgi:hypothetical protein
MLLSPYKKSGINYISAQQCFRIMFNSVLELYSLILSFYLGAVILSFDQHWWYFYCDKVS